MQLAFLEMCPVVYQQEDIVFLFHPSFSSQNARTSVCIQVMCIVNASEFVPYLALLISMCHPQKFFMSVPKWYLILTCRSNFVHHTLAATAEVRWVNTMDICICSNAKGCLEVSTEILALVYECRMGLCYKHSAYFYFAQAERSIK